MAKELTLSGCAASALACKMARVEVVCSYPIRPYTAIMMELVKWIHNGELDAEFVHGEGEHAQFSVVIGASASGASASGAASATSSVCASGVASSASSTGASSVAASASTSATTSASASIAA